MKNRLFVAFALAACLGASTLAPQRASAQQLVLSDHDQAMVDAYQVMQAVTMGLLGATAMGGAVQLYNLPTLLGDGACETGSPIFGDFACSHQLSLVHGVLGVATLASYATTAGFAFAAPNLDRGSEDTVTDVLGVIHGVGIGLTAALGIAAANPGLFGLGGSDARNFSRTMRTIHFIVAMVTVSAFATHMAVDYIGTASF